MVNLPILALLAFAWYGVGLPAPFSAQVHTALTSIAPYAVWLVAAFIFRDAVNRILTDLYGKVVGVAEALGALVLTLLGVVVIAPVMVADTFLLGHIAQWAWKHQIGPILLIILSSVALALIGGFSREVMRKYLVAAVAVGVALIVWGYMSQSWTSTRRVIYKFDAGRVSMDPAQGLKVKTGDRIVFSAFGKTEFVWRNAQGEVINQTTLSPQGNLERLVGERPFGELKFEVLNQKTGTVYGVSPQEAEGGPTHILGFDPAEVSGGYTFVGEARVPAGADGKLSVAFHGLGMYKAETGSIRLTIQVNPEKSFVGRMLGQRGYMAVLYTLGWTLAVFGAYGFLVAVILPPGVPLARPLLLVVAVVLWLATVGAARDATGVNSWGEMARLTVGGSFTPAGAPHVRRAYRRQETFTLTPGQWVEVTSRLPIMGIVDADLSRVKGEVLAKFKNGAIVPFRGDLKALGSIEALKGEGTVVVKW